MAQKESQKVNRNLITEISSKNVISVPPTMRIIEGIQMMSRHNFRRLPITDAGTKKLIGIVTLTDVIDMMGGGNRYNLIAVKHKGSLLSALNDNLREIATENVTGFSANTTIKDAAKILVESGHGGFPILKSDNTLEGIVTEYDIIKRLACQNSDLCVSDVMTKNPQVISPDMQISKVTKIIVAHGYRRLPVVKDNILIGIVTATDIMGYIGKGKIFSSMQSGTVDEILNLPVRDIMTAADLRTVSPELSVTDAAKEMITNGVGAFPVISGNRIAGIVTEFDLVKALAKEF
ncbi:MAG: CBS domain-containing protein [Methanocorpusculum sp.]|nr:CBS domain-containing protein [Methanocorpusculum sp.]